MTIAEKLTAIAENQQKVYDAGYKDGMADAGDTDAAYQQGVTDGKQAEREAFWDRVQNYGAATEYSYMFSSVFWTKDTFRPKHNITFSGDCSYCFAYWSEDHSEPFDLVEWLEELGISLDTQRASNLIGLCERNTLITRFGVLDTSAARSLTSLFSNCTNLQVIDKIILDGAGTRFFSSAFSSCSALTDVAFDGTIGQSINFSWSPLSVDSMKNIIEHLKDFNGTGNENTMTLKLSDACWTALDDDCAAPDGNTWKDYVFYTLCWST